MIRKYRQNAQSGFTTIELLVVIAVIAVLAAGVITAANRLRTQAQEQQVRGILTEIGGVQEQIASESGGEYEAASSGNTVGSGDDSRLVDIRDRIQDVDADLELYLETGTNNQSFAAAVARPNDASGGFCVDNQGESFGYNEFPTVDDPSTAFVTSGGEVECASP